MVKLWNKLICGVFGCRGYVRYFTKPHIDFELTCMRCKKNHEYVFRSQEKSNG